MQSVLAMIPCRAGSKRCPAKNRRLLNGKPLWRHSYDFSLDCNIPAVISTDDEFIFEECAREGIDYLRRPSDLSTDVAPMLGVLLHVAENSPADRYIILHPTSPIRSKDVMRKILETKAAVACTGNRTNPMTFENGVPLFKQVIRSQHWPFSHDGNIYITTRERLLKERTLYSNYVEFIEESDPYSLQIDTPDEFWMFERLLRP